MTTVIYHSETSDAGTGDALQLNNFPLVVPVRKTVDTESSPNRLMLHQIQVKDS